MKEAWEQVKGFKASVAEQVIKQSGGNQDRVKENTIMAVEGAFDVQRCGSSLATCPYVPPSAKEAILKMAEKTPRLMSLEARGHSLWTKNVESQFHETAS